MLKITDETFESEVIEANIPVLIKFEASWCPPCKMMEPMVEKLSIEYQDHVKIVSINIDRNAKTVDSFRVTGVPTFLCYMKGVQFGERLVGAQTENNLRKLIDMMLEIKN